MDNNNGLTKKQKILFSIISVITIILTIVFIIVTSKDKQKSNTQELPVGAESFLQEYIDKATTYKYNEDITFDTYNKYKGNILNNQSDLIVRSCLAALDSYTGTDKNDKCGNYGHDKLSVGLNGLHSMTIWEQEPKDIEITNIKKLDNSDTYRVTTNIKLSLIEYQREELLGSGFTGDLLENEYELNFKGVVFLLSNKDNQFSITENVNIDKVMKQFFSFWDGIDASLTLEDFSEDRIELINTTKR